MNNRILLTLLMVAGLLTTYAQPTTNMGQDSGDRGNRGSYFGRLAGAALIGDVPPPSGEDLRTDNTFVGDQCGSHTIRSGNTAVGSFAFNANTTGIENVAIGFFALSRNTTGHHNVAVGVSSLVSLTTGTFNSSLGVAALGGLTTGTENTAVGSGAASATTTGIFNTALGASALSVNATGLANTGVGWGSGPASGQTDLANSTAIGYLAKTTGSNQIRLGNNNVLSIGGRVGWSTLSDGRFKKDIKEDVAGLAFINQLRPVSYVVDKAAINKFLGVTNADGVPASTGNVRETGFIAQEVEALVKKTSVAFNGVDAPQGASDHYSLRYAEFVIPLVKAVQELSAQIEAQQSELSALKKQLAAQVSEKDPSAARTSSGTLSQNVPNPFSYDTEINISTPETARTASVIVYNLEGKQIKVIPVQATGEVSVKVQGGDMAPGMYIYSLMIDGKVMDSKRMVMVGN
jgi:trimeric autotransporter adhesin